MAMKTSWIIAFIFCGVLAQASPPLLSPPVASQKRDPGESFEQALARYEASLRAARQFPSARVKTAYSKSTSWEKLSFDQLPNWADNQVQEGFRQARDSRYLKLPESPDFSRRASWLYPDDGCFARAALTGQKLAAWGYERPSKLFIFGKLAVKTPNAPGGAVYWWYHVVPVIRSGGEPFVIDPAIDASRALPALAWVKAMVRDPQGLKNAKFSICHSNTYQPYDPCETAAASEEANALVDQRQFLRREWDRLRELGRNPRKELGDSPPWSGL
jgi:hypothetical protein